MRLLGRLRADDSATLLQSDRFIHAARGITTTVTCVSGESGKRCGQKLASQSRPSDADCVFHAHVFGQVSDQGMLR